MQFQLLSQPEQGEGGQGGGQGGGHGGGQGGGHGRGQGGVQEELHDELHEGLQLQSQVVMTGVVQLGPRSGAGQGGAGCTGKQQSGARIWRQ